MLQRTSHNVYYVNFLINYYEFSTIFLFTNIYEFLIYSKLST